MHRSGTTMVTGMLRDLGLFVGADLDENYESMAFLRLSDWALRQSGGAWDNPRSVRWLYESDELVSMTAEYLRSRLKGFEAVRYLGLRRCALGRGLGNGITGPWGWKDPRVVPILPLWLRIFPNATIVYIYRNGVSVASSLRKRAQRQLLYAQGRHRFRESIQAYRILAKRGGFGWSARCLTLDGAFGLWEEYVDMAAQTLKGVEQEPITVQYERLLSHPLEQLELIATGCGLSHNTGELRRVAATADQGRADSRRWNEEEVSFYETVRQTPAMTRLGYGIGA